MYMVQNNHPAIIDRKTFNRVQEEMSRRNAISPQSPQKALTASGKHSKYALTEVLKCGECGSRYRRCTWTSHGKKRIVWRCINRLDNGTKYCSDSLTVLESSLHQAIVRALRQFDSEDEVTYLTLMKATIGEAIGINGGSDEIDLLQRQIDALNKRMITIATESLENNTSFEDNEAEYKEISEQITQLSSRISAINESLARDNTRKDRLQRIQEIIAQRRIDSNTYDDAIVRHMIDRFETALCLFPWFDSVKEFSVLQESFPVTCRRYVHMLFKLFTEKVNIGEPYDFGNFSYAFICFKQFTGVTHFKLDYVIFRCCG